MPLPFPCLRPDLRYRQPVHDRRLCSPVWTGHNDAAPMLSNVAASRFCPGGSASLPKLQHPAHRARPGHSLPTNPLSRMATPMAIRTTAPTATQLTSSPRPMPSRTMPKMMLPRTGRR
jgi:hypothetical protein